MATSGGVVSGAVGLAGGRGCPQRWRDKTTRRARLAKGSFAEAHAFGKLQQWLKRWARTCTVARTVRQPTAVRIPPRNAWLAAVRH